MLYQEALVSLICFIKSVPRCFGSYQVVVGCDANAQRVQHKSTSGVVGPRSSPNSVDPERSRELLGFTLAHELVATNTFDGCPGIVGEASAPDAQWTHMWYKIIECCLKSILSWPLPALRAIVALTIHSTVALITKR